MLFMVMFDLLPFFPSVCVVFVTQKVAITLYEKKKKGRKTWCVLRLGKSVGPDQVLLFWSVFRLPSSRLSCFEPKLVNKTT